MICPRPATARWAATPIPLGIGGSMLLPLVLGPDRIPVVTSLADTPDGPELAVLAALPHAARSHLEELMKTGTYPYQSEFTEQLRDEGREEGREEGRIESKATAVLTVLDTAGVELPDAARTRITDCTDPDQLDSWLRRAVTATTADDLFR